MLFYLNNLHNNFAIVYIYIYRHLEKQDTQFILGNKEVKNCSNIFNVKLQRVLVKKQKLFSLKHNYIQAKHFSKDSEEKKNPNQKLRCFKR